MGTAFQNAWINEVIWKAMLNWTGVDQYDPANPVGQRFLDEFEADVWPSPRILCAGRQPRPRDHPHHAFADAHPLTPRGVKEAWSG